MEIKLNFYLLIPIVRCMKYKRKTYKDISSDVKYRFDTSNYPPDHRSCIPSGLNKKVFSMFKDEVGGKVIDEWG